jgi:hypothetical protein
VKVLRKVGLKNLAHPFLAKVFRGPRNHGVQRVFLEANFDLNLNVLKRVKIVNCYLLFISALFRVMNNVLFKFGEGP